MSSAINIDNGCAVNSNSTEFDNFNDSIASSMPPSVKTGIKIKQYQGSAGPEFGPQSPLTLPPIATMADVADVKEEADVGVNNDSERHSTFRDAIKELAIEAAPVTPNAVAAAKALTNILNKIGVLGRAADLAGLQKADMDDLIVAVSILGATFFGKGIDAKCKSIELLGIGQEHVRNNRCNDYQEKIRQENEKANKAHKAGIFSVVFDWVISSVEVAIGVGKIIGGDIPGGTLSLLAGTAGMVKAICETLAMLDPDNAKLYKEIAKIAGYIQLVCEILGGVSDMVMMVRSLAATKIIATTAKTVLESGVEPLAKQLATQLGKAAANIGNGKILESCAALIESIAKEVASQAVKKVQQGLRAILSQIFEQASSAARGFASKFGGTTLLQTFSEVGIEKIVKESIEQVVKQSAAALAKKGMEIGAEELTQQIVKQLEKNIIKAVAGACFSMATSIRSILPSAAGIGQNIMAKWQAEIQQIIAILMLEIDSMDKIIDDWEKQKEHAREILRNLVGDYGKAQEGNSEEFKRLSAAFIGIAAKKL